MEHNWYRSSKRKMWWRGIKQNETFCQQPCSQVFEPSTLNSRCANVREQVQERNTGLGQPINGGAFTTRSFGCRQPCSIYKYLGHWYQLLGMLDVNEAPLADASETKTQPFDLRWVNHDIFLLCIKNIWGLSRLNAIRPQLLDAGSAQIKWLQNR